MALLVSALMGDNESCFQDTNVNAAQFGGPSMDAESVESVLQELEEAVQDQAEDDDVDESLADAIEHKEIEEAIARSLRELRLSDMRSGSRYRYGQDKKSRKPCMWFAETGSCPYRDHCRFTHDHAPSSTSFSFPLPLLQGYAAIGMLLASALLAAGVALSTLTVRGRQMTERE